MLFLLLPLILNPFGVILRWMPALYLAAWPIIIQTLGRDALILQAILLILFILTCDITREVMLKLIGFDLISLPAGVLLLALLLTDKGAALLSFVTPVCGTLLVAIEPVFLLIESLIIMDMIKRFNKWISSLSNVRDDDPHDLSSWEPPLSRSSMVMRIVVILIAVASYIGAYLLVQEAKTLLGPNERDIPVQFNHAIALLATLQLIALTATIYKEEGILSESAMVALIATVPIFIGAWSFNHLKKEADLSSSWSSYFPFSLLSWPPEATGVSGAGPTMAELAAGATSGRGGPVVFGDQLATAGEQRLDFGAFEQSVNLFAPADSFVKSALLAASRQLIMLINSILGLSMDKLAKFYFGPDFWYILAARLACLVWWLLSGAQPAGAADRISGGGRALLAHDDDERPAPSWRALGRKWRQLNAWLPLSKKTLIKILFVLAYAQMLVQQLENKQNLVGPTTAGAGYQQLLIDQNGAAPGEQRACCAGGGGSAALGEANQEEGLLDNSAGWLACMWNSAKACSSSGGAPLEREGASRAARFWEAARSLLGQLAGFLAGLLAHAHARLLSLGAGLHAAHFLWLARWRSPIVQRLMQSAFVQVHYICALTLTGEPGEEEADFL